MLQLTTWLAEVSAEAARDAAATAALTAVSPQRAGQAEPAVKPVP